MKPEQSVMRRHESLERQNRRPTSMIWTIVGGAALVAIGALVIVMIPDIKKYIKISTM